LTRIHRNRSISWRASTAPWFLIVVTLSVAASLVPATVASANAPPAPTVTVDLPADLLNTYIDRFPDVPRSQLLARLALSPARKRLLERIALDYQQTFAGSWYDYRKGIWQLNSTTQDSAESMARLAQAIGIATQTRLVRYSLATLQARAGQITGGQDPVLGALGANRAGIDVQSNRVVVALPSAVRSRVGISDPMVTTTDAPAEAPQPLACANRRNCGRPLRGGLVIWRGNYDNPWCSLGLTATATDGSRWALTAGHCIEALNEDWGHGEQRIGPARQFRTAGDVDVARIRIANAYWLENTNRGYLFATPSSTHDIDLAIQFSATIEVDDGVCYGGWHSNYTGFTTGNFAIVSGDTCGLIESAGDAAAGSMPRVGAGINACGGDSGSAIIYYPGNGERWAYGLLSNGAIDQGDHCTEGKDIWFSPLPSINAFFDANSAAIIRADTR
jgi:streptogrisin C